VTEKLFSPARFHILLMELFGNSFDESYWNEVGFNLETKPALEQGFNMMMIIAGLSARDGVHGLDYLSSFAKPLNSFHPTLEKKSESVSKKPDSTAKDVMIPCTWGLGHILFGSLMNKQFVSVVICCVIFIEFTHSVFFQNNIHYLKQFQKILTNSKSFRNDCISRCPGIKNDASACLAIACHIKVFEIVWFCFRNQFGADGASVRDDYHFDGLEWECTPREFFSSVNEAAEAVLADNQLPKLPPSHDCEFHSLSNRLELIVDFEAIALCLIQTNVTLKTNDFTGDGKSVIETYPRSVKPSSNVSLPDSPPGDGKEDEEDDEDANHGSSPGDVDDMKASQANQDTVGGTVTMESATMESATMESATAENEEVPLPFQNNAKLDQLFSEAIGETGGESFFSDALSPVLARYRKEETAMSSNVDLSSLRNIINVKDDRDRLAFMDLTKIVIHLGAELKEMKTKMFEDHKAILNAIGSTDSKDSEPRAKHLPGKGKRNK